MVARAGDGLCDTALSPTRGPEAKEEEQHRATSPDRDGHRRRRALGGASRGGGHGDPGHGGGAAEQRRGGVAPGDRREGNGRRVRRVFPTGVTLLVYKGFGLDLAAAGRCNDADAGAGTCPTSSQIATGVVSGSASLAGLFATPVTAPIGVFLANASNGDLADVVVEVSVQGTIQSARGQLIGVNDPTYGYAFRFDPLPTVTAPAGTTVTLDEFTLTVGASATGAGTTPTPKPKLKSCRKGHHHNSKNKCVKNKPKKKKKSGQEGGHDRRRGGDGGHGDPQPDHQPGDLLRLVADPAPGSLPRPHPDARRGDRLLAMTVGGARRWVPGRTLRRRWTAGRTSRRTAPGSA